MSTNNRVQSDQLEIGAPLPVDVYDIDSRLLLRKGNIIASHAQLERLVREGMVTVEPLPPRHPPPQDPSHGTRESTPADDPRMQASARTLRVETSRPIPTVSVYAQVTHVTHQLDALLDKPHCSAHKDFSVAINDVTDIVRWACAMDVDAALAHIMFFREAIYPVRQSINVALITALLLKRLHVNEMRIQSAVCAALTMNLSLREVMEEAYHVKDLTGTQRHAVAEHPAASARMLADLRITDELWLTLVEQHHELQDGSGYPNKLTGKEVELEAQVIGLADRYCSGITERDYRAAIPPQTALKVINERNAKSFDPRLFSALVFWIGIYPPGTVVRLANDEMGVVARRMQDLRSPIVYAVAGGNGYPYAVARKRITASQSKYRIADVLPRDAINLNLDPEILWPRMLAEEMPELATQANWESRYT